MEPHLLLFNERFDPLTDVLALIEQIKAISSAKLVVLGGIAR